MDRKDLNLQFYDFLGLWLLGPVVTITASLFVLFVCRQKIEKNIINLEHTAVKLKSLNRVPQIYRNLNIFTGSSSFNSLENEAASKTWIKSNNIPMESLKSINNEELVALNAVLERKIDLLHKIIPVQAASQLLKGFNVKPQVFGSITLLFTNISNFAEITGHASPFEYIHILDNLFKIFDTVISKYDVYKVETVKDTYFVASGLDFPKCDHTSDLALLALDLMESVAKLNNNQVPNDRILLRIGMHLGPVAAGVIGLDKPRYCLFGDTVNMTSRLSTTGEPFKIHLSSECHLALAKSKRFSTEERGLTYIKGKGLVQTYWLTGVYRTQPCHQHV